MPYTTNRIPVISYEIEQKLQQLCADYLHSPNAIIREHLLKEIIDYCMQLLDSLQPISIIKILKTKFGKNPSILEQIIAENNFHIQLPFLSLNIQLLARLIKYPHYEYLIKTRSYDAAAVSKLIPTADELILAKELLSTIPSILSSYSNSAPTKDIKHLFSLVDLTLVYRLLELSTDDINKMSTIVLIEYIVKRIHNINTKNYFFSQYLNMINPTSTVNLQNFYKLCYGLLRQNIDVKLIYMCLFYNKEQQIYFKPYISTNVNDVESILDFFNLLVKHLTYSEAKNVFRAHITVIKNHDIIASKIYDALREIYFDLNEQMRLKILDLLNTFLHKDFPIHYLIIFFETFYFCYNSSSNYLKDNQKAMIAPFWQTAKLYQSLLETNSSHFFCVLQRLDDLIPIANYYTALCMEKGISFVARIIVARNEEQAIYSLFKIFKLCPSYHEMLWTGEGLALLKKSFTYYAQRGYGETICNLIENLWCHDTLSSCDAISILHPLIYSSNADNFITDLHQLSGKIHQRENSILADMHFNNVVYHYEKNPHKTFTVEILEPLIEYFYHQANYDLTVQLIDKALAILNNNNHLQDDLLKFLYNLLESIINYKKQNSDIDSDYPIYNVMLADELFILSLSLEQRVNLNRCYRIPTGKKMLNGLLSFLNHFKFNVIDTIINDSAKLHNLAEKIIMHMSFFEMSINNTYVDDPRKIHFLQQIINDAMNNSSYRILKNVLHTSLKFLDYLLSKREEINAYQQQKIAKDWAQFALVKSLKAAKDRIPVIQKSISQSSQVDNDIQKITFKITDQAFSPAIATLADQQHKLELTQGLLSQCAKHKKDMPYLLHTRLPFSDVIINIYRGIDHYIQFMQTGLTAWQTLRSNDGRPRAVAFKNLLKQYKDYKHNPTAICVIALALFHNEKGRNLVNFVLEQFALDKELLIKDLELFLTINNQTKQHDFKNQINKVIQFINGHENTIPEIGIILRDANSDELTAINEEPCHNTSQQNNNDLSRVMP